MKSGQLELAHLHVARGEQLVADQERRVQLSKEHLAQAEALLTTFQSSLELWVKDAKRIEAAAERNGRDR
jgi:hypothetical protein